MDEIRELGAELVVVGNGAMNFAEAFREDYRLDSPLLIDPELRKPFLQHHRDLLDADYWKGIQQDIHDGRQRDVFPYSVSKRFRYIYGEV